MSPPRRAILDELHRPVVPATAGAERPIPLVALVAPRTATGTPP